MNGNQWARLPAYVTGLVNQELLLQNEVSRCGEPYSPRTPASVAYFFMKMRGPTLRGAELASATYDAVTSCQPSLAYSFSASSVLKYRTFSPPETSFPAGVRYTSVRTSVYSIGP